jgi:arsenite methyltransferase
MEEIKVKKVVREHYAKAAKQGNSCCGCNNEAELISKQIGYGEEDLAAVPGGANLGLGCGNPVALASLKEGETVLDLGSGAGFDCFLASNKVGKNGKIIGVDMTPEMVEKARENAEKGHYENVEFRLGEIENLPIPDNSVDAVISNCVINLAQNKRRAFSEAFRVLKPTGRIMISDIVLLEPLPDAIRNSIEAYVGCVAGASLKDEYIKIIEAEGFQNVRVVGETSFPIDYLINDPKAQAILRNLDISPERLRQIAETIVSVKIYGVKPTG